jgi:hypothetical protein
MCQAWHVGLTAYGIYGLTVAKPSWPAAQWAGYTGSALLVLGVLATPTLLVALPGPYWPTYRGTGRIVRVPRRLTAAARR